MLVRFLNKLVRSQVIFQLGKIKMGGVQCVRGKVWNMKYRKGTTRHNQDIFKTLDTPNIRTSSKGKSQDELGISSPLYEIKIAIHIALLTL